MNVLKIIFVCNLVLYSMTWNAVKEYKKTSLPGAGDMYLLPKIYKVTKKKKYIYLFWANILLLAIFTVYILYLGWWQ